MNIVFMGTPDFAVPALETLIEEQHTISAVVTQPDKPKGRGNKQTMPPVKEAALKHNIPILQPEKIKGDENFYKHILSLNPDLIVVVAFGQILPEGILAIPKYGCINIHGSLLPKYRGAAPIQWAILNEEKVTGVTIMYMDKGMDTGDMLVKEEIPIDKEETYASLHDKMKEIGAKTLQKALPLIFAGGKGREKQNEEESTYAPMISKMQGEIDWNKPNHTIDAQIRGLNPWPTGYTYYKGEMMKIWKAQSVSCYREGKPGTVLSADKEGIFVKTQSGGILIEEIQMPNKKRMAVSEYIKGNKIESGTVLGI